MCGWWRLAVLVVMMAASCPGAGFTNQFSRYTSYDWDTEDGLPNDSINTALQAGGAYFWLATQEGLVRFDGVKFVSVPVAGFTGENDRAFNALCEGKEGTLWVASQSGRVCGLKNGRATELALPAPVTNCFLTRLFESRDGALWIGTETNGLLRWNEGKFTRLTTAEGLGHNSIRSLCEDNQGNIWIATAGGLSRWHDGTFTNLTVAAGMLHNSIRVVYFDRDGFLWVASQYGLTRMKDGVLTHFRKRDGLSDNLISAIYKDRQGVLWVGTYNGLNRLENDKITVETRADGTSYDRINSIFEDTEGNLWVSTRNGLSRLRPRVITAYTELQGLTYNNATSVLEDSDGSLWITYWGGGINHVQDGVVTPYRRREGLPSDLVLTLCETRSGDRWFGLDYDGGINVLRGNVFVPYRELEGMTDHSVRAILEDRAGNMWIGTRTALLQFKDGRFKRYTTKDGLPSNSIEAIVEDRAGNLWFGTDGGLVTLRDGVFKKYTTLDGLSHDMVTAIHEDPDGALWLGTHGGLDRLRDGKISAFRTRAGIFRDEIYALVEDDLGFLWLTSHQGIFRVSRQELNDFAARKHTAVNCVSFDKRDGMASVECKGYGQTAAWKGCEGQLWFPTSKGIVSVNPRAARVNTTPPRIALEEVQVNKTPVDLGHEANLIAGNQELAFRYTAFSFSAPEKISFKYRLEGFDSDWINAGSTREAHYHHLPAGNYRFQVMAANGDGVASTEPVSFGLVLSPPFWRTGWFLSLAGLAIIGAVAAAVRYVSVQNLHRRLAVLEQQHAVEKERARIAQDMHDDLGANLTQICVLSELARRDSAQPQRVAAHTNAISDTARELVQSMDEIVWSANPRNDNLRRLAGYIFQYAENFLAPTPVRGRFEQPVALPELPLSAELRHDIFLAVKEALNNVVKHSQASEVWVRVKLAGGKLEIDIEDNGRGFAAENGRPFGNGLANMQKRVESAGGCFTATSAPGAGTKIKIIVAVPATA